MVSEHEPQSQPDGEPTVLGAAQTLPFRRETRAERAERRRAARGRDREATPPAAIAADGSASAGPAPTGPALREYSDVEHVFEPHSARLPPLGEYLRSIWERRRFIRELAKADLQRSRAGTIFGGLWGILDPLLLSGIYILVFTIIREGQRPTDFIPLLIGGIMLFQLATGGMNEGAGSIAGGKNLMLNSTFPRAVLPLATIYKGLIKFLPVLAVYPVIYLAMGADGGRSLVALPLVFTVQIVLMIGMALFFATLVVYFRDVKNVLNYITRLLLFSSPIIYPLDFIPEGIRAVLVWQPFFALFASYQTILGGGAVPWHYVGQAAIWATGFLVVGGFIFLRRERDFANHL